MVKNLEKITGLNFHNLVLSLAENRYFVIIQCKMLKIEFKFKHTMLITSVNHFGQFILVKVKKDFRKSQAQFGEKLRKLRLRQNDGFLMEKNVYKTTLDVLIN